MRFLFAMYSSITLGGVALALPAADVSGIVQSVALNPAHPLFIPTHPRVTTTIRFPREIGAPDGAVGIFTEDAAKTPGEYLVTWQMGDAYLTVSPLRESQMANLNVPFGGETYVFYFYQVADPLKAIASVNLLEARGAPAVRVQNVAPVDPGTGANRVRRQSAAPASDPLPITPARLVGFLDRLKLIHATPLGPGLASLVEAMKVQVAVTREEQASTVPTQNPVPGIEELGSGMNDAGLYQIVLLRVVRDPRLHCLGFICLLRNTSDQPLCFDATSFGARAGAGYLGTRIGDAPAILAPHEQSPAYFVIETPLNSPLLAANAWRLSIDLVRNRVNPGAAITREFSPAPKS